MQTVLNYRSAGAIWSYQRQCRICKMRVHEHMHLYACVKQVAVGVLPYVVLVSSGGVAQSPQQGFGPETSDYYPEWIVAGREADSIHAVIAGEGNTSLDAHKARRFVLGRCVRARVARKRKWLASRSTRPCSMSVTAYEVNK
jgi:hypothetical protein